MNIRLIFTKLTSHSYYSSFTIIYLYISKFVVVLYSHSFKYFQQRLKTLDMFTLDPRLSHKVEKILKFSLLSVFLRVKTKSITPSWNMYENLKQVYVFEHSSFLFHIVSVYKFWMKELTSYNNASPSMSLDTSTMCIPFLEVYFSHYTLLLACLSFLIIRVCAEYFFC